MFKRLWMPLFIQPATWGKFRKSFGQPFLDSVDYGMKYYGFFQ